MKVKVKRMETERPNKMYREWNENCVERLKNNNIALKQGICWYWTTNSMDKKENKNKEMEANEQMEEWGASLWNTKKEELLHKNEPKEIKWHERKKKVERRRKNNKKELTRIVIIVSPMYLPVTFAKWKNRPL